MGRRARNGRRCIGAAVVLSIGATARVAHAQAQPPSGMPDPVRVTLGATPARVELEIRETLPPEKAGDPPDIRWRTVCTTSPARACDVWLPRGAVLRADGDFPASRPFRLASGGATTLQVRPGQAPAAGIAFLGVGGGAVFVGAAIAFSTTLPHSDDPYDVTAQDRANTENRKLLTAGIVAGAGLAVCVVGLVILLTNDATTVDAKSATALRPRTQGGVRVGSGLWLTPRGLAF